MIRGIVVAWLQLTREKRRFAAALAGIAFAVILVLMQLGFQNALYKSATNVHDHVTGDLVLTSSQYQYLFATGSFTKRRLYSALALDTVESIAPLYVRMAMWKNPLTGRESPIFVMGFDPAAGVFDFQSVKERLDKIKMPDVALFDSASRPLLGPIPEMLRQSEVVVTEVNGRKIEIAGLFTVGVSFGATGHMITSDLNFFRLFGGVNTGLINMGFITLKPGADPEVVRTQLEAILPEDVRVLTREAFVEQELDFWVSVLPIGFIFNFGSLMGAIVGVVIVYQILYTDVSDHFAEYATLKAMGYANRYLFGVVLQEALILSVFGFLPGYAIAHVMYIVAQRETGMPIFMTSGRVVMVFVLTIVMCATSGAIAMRKIKTADPADIF